MPRLADAADLQLPQNEASPPLVHAIGPQAKALRIRGPVPPAVLRFGCEQAIFPGGRPLAPKSMFYQSVPNHSITRKTTGKPASAAYVKR